VWLGVSVERQKEADERIPLLLQTPAAIRFISAEPLLGPIDLMQAGALKIIWWNTEVPGGRPPVPKGIDWCIVGGESGKDARPMHPAWAQSLRDQCSAAGVPFFFKQWGEWAPAERTTKIEARIHMPAQNADVWAFPDSTKEGWRHGAVSIRVGKKAAGRLLDGRTWDEFPEAPNSTINASYIASHSGYPSD
jgi:protein gp37